MLTVKPLSQFRWSRHWAVTLSRWPCLLHPCTSVGGDVKEPVTLFEKSRGRRPRCHGLSDLCRHRSGWARCDQNMDWSGCKSAPLHADVRSHLSGSSTIQPLAASEESWHRCFFFCFFFFNPCPSCANSISALVVLCWCFVQHSSAFTRTSHSCWRFERLLSGRGWT